MTPQDALKLVDQVLSTQRLSLTVPEFNALKQAMETLVKAVQHQAETQNADTP